MCETCLLSKWIRLNLFKFDNYLVGILAIHNRNDIKGNICGKECTTGTFVNSTTNVCSRYCDSTCSTCSYAENASTCTSCKFSTSYLSYNPGSLFLIFGNISSRLFEF